MGVGGASDTLVTNTLKHSRHFTALRASLSTGGFFGPRWGLLRGFCCSWLGAFDGGAGGFWPVRLPACLGGVCSVVVRGKGVWKADSFSSVAFSLKFG